MCFCKMEDRNVIFFKCQQIFIFKGKVISDLLGLFKKKKSELVYVVYEFRKYYCWKIGKVEFRNDVYQVRGKNDIDW